MDNLINQLSLFAQNDMYQRDVLVAVVATCLGLNIIYMAATNNRWVFQLGTVAAINDRLGPQKTRLVLALIGTSLIMVGAHLAFSGHSRTPKKQTPLDTLPHSSLPRSVGAL